MLGREYYALKRINGSKFYIRPSALQTVTKELNNFLKSDSQLNTETFAKSVMFSQEIKANNQVEGYRDDIEVIRQAIRDAESIRDTSKRDRILNLYYAYSYILQTPNIDKDTLKKLYSIISRNILSQYDLNYMGEYYRTRPVYILKSGRLDLDYDEGIPFKKIDEFMENYFQFLNTEIQGNETDEYIKSQILHFYFVYIHPYFDVNGRTSRTLAMWYLLNKKAYAYIIFNRGISFKGSTYDKTIIKSKNSGDLTYFIELMLETVKLELEKEYVMQTAATCATDKLNATDYQSLLYFLSMKGLKTVFDFGMFYNRHNSPKSIREIYEEMIVPLLDKGVLDISSETKKEINGIKNKVLILRPMDLDPNKVHNLQLK